MTLRRLIPLPAAVAAVAGLAAVPVAQARSTKITVAPTSGHRSTTFSVSFISPHMVYGSDSDEYERYRVTLLAPKGCGRAPVSAVSRGEYDIGERVTLRATAGKGGFCAGVWRGKVTYEEYLADTQEDCSSAEAPESGSSMGDEIPTGTYSKLRLPVGSFKVRVR